MTRVGFISGSSVVQTPSSSSSVRSSRIHSLGMWNASRRSARLTLIVAQVEQAAQALLGLEAEVLEREPLDRHLRRASCRGSTARRGRTPPGSARREMKPISFIADTMRRRVARHRALEERHHPAPHPLADTVAVAPKSRKTIGRRRRPRRRRAAAAGSRGADRRGRGRRRRSAGSRPRRRARAAARRSMRSALQALADRATLAPVHPLGGQHARRRELGDHARQAHVRRCAPAKLAAIFSIAAASSR